MENLRNLLDDKFINAFFALYKGDELSLFSLEQLLSFTNLPEADYVSKVLYKEGMDDISAVLDFRTRVNALKQTLASRQLDVEEFFSSLKQDPFDGLLIPDEPFDYDAKYFDLSRQLEELRQEREYLSLECELGGDDWRVRMKGLDDRIAKTEKRFSEVSRILDIEERNQCACDCIARYGKILDSIRQISLVVEEFLRENSLLRMLEAIGSNLYFADIVDVVYELFKGLFVSDYSKLDLLETLSLRRSGAEALMAGKDTAISVLVYTIARYYLPGKEGMEDWDARVIGCFGIDPESYRGHRSAYGSSLDKKKKPLVTALINYLKGLNELKSEVFGGDHLPRNGG